MLVEILVSSALILLVIIGTFQGIRSLASISERSRELESVEEMLFDAHINPPLCPAHLQREHLIRECTIGEKRETRVVKFDRGFSLPELLLSLLIISLLLTLSYPSIRLMLRSRKLHLERTESSLALKNTTREIKHRLASASLIPLKDNLIDVSTSDFWRSLLPKVAAKDSSLVLSLEPLFARPLKTIDFSGWQPEQRVNSVTVSGSIPSSKHLFLGICASNWILLEVVGRNNQLLRVRSIFPHASAPPTALFPLRRAEIIYLDEIGTLRRFRIAERTTDPLLHNVESFQAISNNQELRVSIHRRDNSSDFSLRLEKDALLQLAL